MVSALSSVKGEENASYLTAKQHQTLELKVNLDCQCQDLYRVWFGLYTSCTDTCLRQDGDSLHLAVYRGCCIIL